MMKATILVLVMSMLAGAMALLGVKDVGGTVTSNTNPANSVANTTTNNNVQVYTVTKDGRVNLVNTTVGKTPDSPNDIQDVKAVLILRLQDPSSVTDLIKRAARRAAEAYQIKRR